MKRALIFCLVLFLFSCPVGPDKTEESPSSPQLTVDDLFDGQQVGTNLLVSGTASGSSDVEGVYLSVDGCGFTAASGTTNWQTNIVLAPGSSILSIYAKDIAGLISSTAVFHLTVLASPDTVLPTVSILYPSGMDPLGASFTVTGTASDNLELEGVYYAVDGGAFSKFSTSTNWIIFLSFTTTGLHVISVYSRDIAGNRSATNNRSFIINPYVPVTVINSPTNGQVLGDTNLVISGTATDDKVVDKVYVTVGTNAYTLATGTSNWSINMTLPAVSGAYNLRAYSTDIDTNDSAIAQINVVLDLLPPVLYIDGPTNSEIIYYGTFTLHGRALDNNTPYELSTVYFNVNGGPFAALSVDNAGNWNTNISLTNGTYVFRAYARDRVGNIGLTNLVTNEVRIDILTPVVVITNMTNGISVEAPFRIVGTASDDSVVASVWYVIDNSSTTNQALGTDGWRTASLTLSNGIHRADIFAVDVLGKKGDNTNIQFYVDAMPPVLYVNLSNTGSTNYKMTITFEDLAGVKDVYYADPWTDLLQVGTNVGEVSFTYSTNYILSEGLFIFRTYASDRFDHFSAVTTNYYLFDYSSPTILIKKPTNNQIIGANAMIAGEATDNQYMNCIMLEINPGDYVVVYPYTNDGTNYNWQTNVNYPEGVNLVHAYALDSYGNVSATDNTTFIVDTTPPVLSGITPASGSAINTNFTLQGTASDAYGISGVYLEIDHSGIYSNISSMNNWSKALILNEGEHLLSVYAMDMVSNNSLTNEILITNE